MKVLIVTPVPMGSARGNGVTARRWQDMLVDLGHEVVLKSGCDDGQPDHDLLIALHAERSHEAVKTFHRTRPGKPIVVAMTGTDLYLDLPDSPAARESLALAERIIVLHPCAAQSLPKDVRGRARLIIQSAAPPQKKPTKPDGTFAVCVLAHLRAIKAPLLAAQAARTLPAGSRVHVTLAGSVLEPEWEGAAKREAEDNDRFSWRGELPPDEALDLVARSHLLAMSSQLEGGANVISEALATDVPVLATHIPAAVGMLGDGYPGLFPVGDAAALAELMRRAEVEPEFMAELSAACREVAPLVDPRRERSALAGLLTEIEVLSSGSGHG